jgi:hypothetical protein
MRLLLSVLLPVLKIIHAGLPNDLGVPLSFYVIGFLCVIAVGCGLIFLIVLAVKFLVRISKTTNDD